MNSTVIIILFVFRLFYKLYQRSAEGASALQFVAFVITSFSNYIKVLKIISAAFLCGIQLKRVIVKKRPAILHAMLLEKALYGISPLLCRREIVGANNVTIAMTQSDSTLTNTVKLS